jgi:hypothetical protein
MDDQLQEKPSALKREHPALRDPDPDLQGDFLWVLGRTIEDLTRVISLII